MQAKLTKRLVDSVAATDADLFVWDTEVKGFGLKVTRTAVKTYLLQYRMGGRGNPTRRYTIGKHGSPWTPDAARAEAKRLLGLVEKGEDPQAQAPKRDDRIDPLFAEFVERYHRAKGNNVAYVLDLYTRDVRPKWEKRQVGSITRRDVIELLDGIVARGAAIQANRVRALLSTFFNWCVGRDIIPASPCVRIARPTPERQRDRVLTDDELVAVWCAAEAMGYPFGRCIQLLVLTAQRRDEVAAMRWGELDLAAGLWELPGERAKNGRAHFVHFAPMAVAILEAMPRVELAGEEATGPTRCSDLVFTTTGKTPISGFSAAKRAIDARLIKTQRETAEKAGLDPDCARPFEPWTFHDIRRSVTTKLAALKVAPHVVDRILNHSQGVISGVAGVYNRFDYLEERQAALMTWERRLRTLLGTEDGNVVPLPRLSSGG